MHACLIDCRALCCMEFVMNVTNFSLLLLYRISLMKVVADDCILWSLSLVLVWTIDLSWRVVLQQFAKDAEGTHDERDVTTCWYDIWALCNKLLLLHFWRLYGQRSDHILLLIGLTLWLGDFLNSWMKIDSYLNEYLNLNLNWDKSYLVGKIYWTNNIQHILH